MSNEILDTVYLEDMEQGHYERCPVCEQDVLVENGELVGNCSYSECPFGPGLDQDDGFPLYFDE